MREYGESGALDYIPGAEVLKTSEEVEERETEHGINEHIAP